MPTTKAIGFDFFGVLGVPGVFGMKPRTEMLALAQALKARGYKIGILSSLSHSRRQEVEKVTEGIFDAIFFCDEVGAYKPGREAYEALADALGVTLSEMIFIDDSESNLAGIDSFGLRGILFTSIEDTKKKLSLI